MGATLQHFLGKFDEFKTLPSGKSFSIKVTDQEATAAANEYLTENKAQVSQLLQKTTGMNLEVEKKLLDGTDIVVDTVMSGFEAMIMTAKEAYDIIFMDHLMPEMDGIECLQNIRKQLG